MNSDERINASLEDISEEILAKNETTADEHKEVSEVRDEATKSLNVASQVEKQISQEQKEELISTQRTRFETNMHRHEGINWSDVEARLNKASEMKIWSLNEMERTGGEPDVVQYREETKECVFIDCSLESPSGRRNICYDQEGQKRAEENGHHPAGNAINMAEAMGIEILEPFQYGKLLRTENFLLDTNSFVLLKTRYLRTCRSSEPTAIFGTNVESNISPGHFHVMSPNGFYEDRTPTSEHTELLSFRGRLII